MRRKTLNVHERFLRHIWSKQYLKSSLSTTDGKPINVIDAGQYNSDSGPDFCNAKIKIGSIIYFGDVEIHRSIIDWLQHHHQEDPRYNSVILHVVLEADSKNFPTVTQSGREVPVLILSNFLQESIHTIWQKAILDERISANNKLKCYNKNNNISIDLIKNWLYRLSIERLEIKLRRFEERLKQLALEKKMTVFEHQQRYYYDTEQIPPPISNITQKDFLQRDLWEQLLYEGIMEGLGYSKNREPFLILSKNLTLKQIKNLKLESTIELEALLFGVSGLLSTKIKSMDDECYSYISKLQKTWEVLCKEYKGEILHEADWRFYPIRPSNFPTIRIAAAVGIINLFLNNDFFRKTILVLKSESSSKNKILNLTNLFNIETSDFWKYHYHFNKKAAKAINTLGTSRIYELIINSILPVSLLYARIFKDRNVREGVLNVYRTLPPPESNSIQRLMEKQFLKGRIKVDSVCNQQAIIQLYKYYCIENRCNDCRIGQAIN